MGDLGGVQNPKTNVGCVTLYSEVFWDMSRPL